jgi:hypothetical protein
MIVAAHYVQLWKRRRQVGCMYQLLATSNAVLNCDCVPCGDESLTAYAYQCYLRSRHCR